VVKPNKVSLENRLLMTLEYLREYRTYFHISRSYGLSESALLPIVIETDENDLDYALNLIAGIYNFELQ
jgi:hypothetical protein